MPESAEAQAALISLLRALSVGLAAHRLFPDDPEQEGFLAAVDRVRDTAADALIEGPVEVEVEGGVFHSHDGPLPSDERLERLALACYERQAERLLVRGIPDAQELTSLYRALSAPVADAVAAGGAALLLESPESASVVLGGVHPEAVEGGGPEVEETQEARGPADPFDLLQEVEEEGGSALEQAELLMARFRSFISELPRKDSEGPDPYAELHDSMAELTPAVRNVLVLVLVERSFHDTFAERLVGTMTDAELASALVAQGSEDPVQLARRMVSAGRRREDLVDLVTSVLDVDQSTAAEETGPLGVPVGTPVAETVMDLVAQELLTGADEDLRALRQASSVALADEQEEALRALHDYLLVEDDLDVLDRVLGVWTARVRAALRAGDAAQVDRFMEVMDAAARSVPDGDSRREALVQRHRSGVLDVRFLREFFADGAGQENEAFTFVLERLGVVAIDILLDVLAEEEDRQTRLQLIGLLSELATGHHALVGKRLSDPRWEVARNAVTILHRAGGREVVYLLEDAARHPAPQVRKEAIWGLFAVAGPDAAPTIRRLASDRDASVNEAALSALGSLTARVAVDALSDVVRNETDRDARRRALEQLGRHPAAEALEALEGLRARGSRPRLPRDLRRRARILARRRRKETR